MSKSSEQAYRLIRGAILSGHFPAGQFVPEDEFAQYCGMSRTPVREAIAQLVAEMLLQRSDTNRVFVPVWSDEDYEELFTLRAYLESHCAQRAALFITDEQIEELKSHYAFIERAITRRPDASVSDFVEGNRRFHRVLMRAAQSERLNQLMQLVVNQIVIHRTAERYSTVDMARSQSDHFDLITALEARDAEWAGSIATSHIRRAAGAYRHNRDRPANGE
ncbi:MAG: GntR family transcriptional regulator [Pseudomonadota bacterium]|uniref:GntR family transcriptional regulator n=1 Tax=Rhizorhabdus phycosphaerae TaxID=2711156 RepID=UPI0013ED5D25|nr:GntR family transcriptional regulator [Rhizorhabdus phycosphaerae]